MKHTIYLILEILAFAGSITLFVGLFWNFRHEWKSIFSKLGRKVNILKSQGFNFLVVMFLNSLRFLCFIREVKNLLNKIKNEIMVFLRMPITIKIIMTLVMIPKLNRLLYVFI